MATACRAVSDIVDPVYLHPLESAIAVTQRPRLTRPAFLFPQYAR